MSTKELHDILYSDWIEDSHNSMKTTLRDLEALASGTVVKEEIDETEEGRDKRSRYWSLGARSFKLTLKATEAMTLSALFDHADRFGLQTHTDTLRELREYAQLEMNLASERKLEWAKRITTGTRFTVLRPGNHEQAHLTQIQQAIIDDRSLEVTYLPRDAGNVECVYQLKPLALSHQDSNTYLSAYVLEEKWPTGCAPEPGATRGKYSSNGPKSMCALMLHRMIKVEPGKRDIPDPENYDVNSIEVQEHLMTIHTLAPVEIKLRLSANLHNRLSENPLAEDQVLDQIGSDWVLTCNLRDTQGLRLFLMSNAADIEVLAPLALRTHISDSLRTAMSFYRDHQE